MCRLKAEQQECEQRIQEFEAEVERVTRKMEDLHVCGCRRGFMFSMAGLISFLFLLPSFLPLIQTIHNHVTQAKQRAQAHQKHFKDHVKKIRDIITDLEKKAEEQRLRAEEATRTASEVCLQWRLLSVWYFILLILCMSVR